VLFLAGFGTYELLRSGSGGGQGPTAAFLPPGHSKAMDVQVIGQQWEWTFRYPTYRGIETPHLVLPADTLIRFHVTSLDAVHSLHLIIEYDQGVGALRQHVQRGVAVEGLVDRRLDGFQDLLDRLRDPAQAEQVGLDALAPAELVPGPRGYRRTATTRWPDRYWLEYSVKYVQADTQ